MILLNDKNLSAQNGPGWCSIIQAWDVCNTSSSRVLWLDFIARHTDIYEEIKHWHYFLLSFLPSVLPFFTPSFPPHVLHVSFHSMCSFFLLFKHPYLKSACRNICNSFLINFHVFIFKSKVIHLRLWKTEFGEFWIFYPKVTRRAGKYGMNMFMKTQLYTLRHQQGIKLIHLTLSCLHASHTTLIHKLRGMQLLHI